MLLALDNFLLVLALVSGFLDALADAFPRVTTLLGLGGLGALGITGGTLFLLAMFVDKGKKKKKKKTTDDTVVSNCPPLPPLSQLELGALVEQGKQEGVLGLMAFVSYVARMLYPTRSDGTAIAWPSKAPFVLPPSVDGALICRWEEIKRSLGELQPPVPEPETPTIADVITDLLSPYPLPGHFYQIKKGDTLDGISRQALNNLIPGLGQKNANRMSYIKDCINTGKRWNVPNYGSPSKSNLFPAQYLTNGIGMRMAFFAYHAPAIQLLLAGTMPPRKITATGSRIPGGSAYGMLWLPPIDEAAATQFDSVVCAGKWDDDSLVSDPPPLFFSLIQGAA